MLKNFRGSPPYFEGCKRRPFCNDSPTWLRSFSAAETGWTDLLKIFGLIVDNKEYTENETNDMTWQKNQTSYRKIQ